jgi:hypothetical protein
MAEGTGAIYNNFKEQVMEGIFNLATGGDTLKLILVSTHTPNIDTHTVYLDVTADEYSTASGYTAAGQSLTGQDVTQDNTDDEGVFDAADLTWTSLGPLSPNTPSHCILYDDTPTTPADPLIAYWTLGTTATNGGNYTIAWGTEGIINLT